MSLWTRIRDAFRPEQQPLEPRRARRRAPRRRRGFLRRIVDRVTGATPTADTEREPREPRYGGGPIYEPEPADYGAPDYERGPEPSGDDLRDFLIDIGFDGSELADWYDYIDDVLSPYG